MLQKLLLKRRGLVRRIPRDPNIVKGSIVESNVTCGKAGCRCEKGEKHAAIYLSQSRQGKTKMTYIPKRHEETVRQGVSRHRELMKVVQELSECNLKILKWRKATE